VKGLSTKHPQDPCPILVPFLADATVHSRSNCATIILQSRDVVGYLLSDCLWNCGCSLQKLLSSAPEKTGRLSQLYVDYSPHLCYSRAPGQHLEDNRIDLYIYLQSCLRIRQPFINSFGFPFTVTIWGADVFMVRILIICQEQRFTMHTDMALSRLVSGRFQRPRGWNNCPPFTPFIRFFG
jgi:hypothetical protein